jgi:hypothetical protein
MRQIGLLLLYQFHYHLKYVVNCMFTNYTRSQIAPIWRKRFNSFLCDKFKLLSKTAFTMFFLCESAFTRFSTHVIYNHAIYFIRSIICVVVLVLWSRGNIMIWFTRYDVQTILPVNANGRACWQRRSVEKSWSTVHTTTRQELARINRSFTQHFTIINA